MLGRNITIEDRLLFVDECFLGALGPSLGVGGVVPKLQWTCPAPSLRTSILEPIILCLDITSAIEGLSSGLSTML